MGLFSYDFSESLERALNYKSNTQKTKEYETIFWEMAIRSEKEQAICTLKKPKLVK
jgi:hypothetical protein